MKRIGLLIITLSVFCSTVASGQTFAVKGVVADTDGNTLDGVSVSLESVTDNNLSQNKYSDENGLYLFENIEKGVYILRAYMITYELYEAEIEITSDAALDITLNNMRTELAEFVVKGERISRNANGYEVNMRGNPISAGLNSLEVMNFLPGLNAQGDNISLNGRPVSEIYIDSRKILDKSELSALRAEDIAKIEIINTKGAAADARQRGGVINIHLRKLANGGIYGSFGARADLSSEHGLYGGVFNGMVNYNVNKFTIYNYTTYSRRNLHEKYNIDTDYYDSGNTISQLTDNLNREYFFGDNISIVYEPTDKHRIGLFMQYLMNHTKPDLLWESVSTASPGEYSKTVTGGKDYLDRYQAALNYDWTLDDKGSGFTLKSDFLYNRSDERMTHNEFEYLNDILNMEYLSDETNKAKSKMFKTEAGFNIVLDDSWELNFGAEGYYNNTHSPVSFGSTDLTLPAFSDMIDIKVSGLAGYVSMDKRFGSINVSGGIRFQNDNVRYNSRSGEVKRGYNYWYPSASLSYAINSQKGTVLTVYYQKSMDALPEHELNPGIRYESQYFYSTGNPNLLPSVSHNISVNQSINNRFVLFYNFSYEKRGWVATNDIDPNDSRVIYSMPINSASSKIQSAGLNFSYKILPVWTIAPTLYWQSANVKYDGENAKYNYVSNNYQCHLFNRLNFKRGWNASVVLSYDSGFTYSGNRYHDVFYATCSVSKSFFDNKLILSLSHADLYFKRRNITKNTDEFRMYTRNSDKAYRFAFSVTYSISKGNKVRFNRAEKIQDIEKWSEKK